MRHGALSRRRGASTFKLSARGHESAFGAIQYLGAAPAGWAPARALNRRLQSDARTKCDGRQHDAHGPGILVWVALGSHGAMVAARTGRVAEHGRVGARAVPTAKRIGSEIFGQDTRNTLVAPRLAPDHKTRLGWLLTRALDCG